MRKILLVLLFTLIVSSLSAGGNRWTSKPPIGSTIDWSHPLSKGFVGCWLMNENGGNIVNDIANKKKGAITNGAFWKPTIKGIGLDFDGVNDSLAIPDTTNWAGRDFSVSFWLNYDTTVEYNRLVYVDDQFLIAITANTNGNKLGWNVEPDNVDGFADIALPNDVWTHIVFVYNNTTLTATFYINGKACSMTNYNPAASGWTNSGGTDNQLFLMNRNGGSNVINGTLLNFYAWNKKLSPSEIIQLYQDPYCFIKPPTIWSMFSTAVAAARRMFIF